MTKTGLAFSDAYVKHVWKSKDSADDAAHEQAFIENLIHNKIYATGFNYKSHKYEIINTDLWDLYLKTRSFPGESSEIKLDYTDNRIIKKGIHIEILFSDIYIFETPYLNKRTPLDNGNLKSGRKPNNKKWEITAAEAVYICFTEGLPENQIDLVKRIEDSVQNNCGTEPLGRETLIKLVRQIYKRCGTI